MPFKKQCQIKKKSKMERIVKSELFTKNSNMQVEENQENGSSQETQIAKPNENTAKKTVNHALVSHINSVHEKLKCSICDKIYYNTSTLNLHIASVHEK